MIKVFLVEDEPIIRERIRNFILSETGLYEYCGDAPDGEMALLVIQEIKPDIVITDIKMPFMDGLELSRFIKDWNHWIEIVIISGYDEFEYAQKAISIGVSEYLLKPVDRENLLDSLAKIAWRIRESKQSKQNLDELYERLSSAKELRKNEFFEQITGGLLSIKDILTNGERFEMNLFARAYVVADVEIDCASLSGEGIMAVQGEVIRFLGDCTGLEWFFKMPGHMVILFLGNSEEEVRERAYGISQSFKYEIERFSSSTVTIGIGRSVDRIGLINQSYESARQVKSLRFKGLIVGIEDRENEEISNGFVFSGESSFKEKMKFAEEEDIPQIIPPYPERRSKDALLKVFYELANMITEARSFLKECVDGGEPVDMLNTSPTELLRIAEDPGKYEDFTCSLIKKLIGYREGSAYVKHRRIIVDARKYIKENYADPALTLQMVASHISLSPNHFCTVFSRETGETFVEYLTGVRLNKAKELLINTNERLSDIAYKVGYNESHYFSFLFKKQEGIAPRDFRSKNRK